MFTCPDCGNVDHLVFDGYPVGDRMLEGVMFEIRKSDNGLQIKVEDDAKEYFESLNEKMWLDQIRECVEGDGVANCPKCRQDVEFDPKPRRTIPVQAKAESINDILKRSDK